MEQSITPFHGGEQFAQWNEENPCYGCGECCSNTRIPLSQLATTPEEIFGELTEYVINPYEPIDLKDIPNEPGVYYAMGKKDTFVVIIGDCPLLGEERECTAHDKPRPWGCVTSGTNSITCNIRGRAHHPENFVSLSDIA